MYAVVAVLSHLTHSPLVAEKVYSQLSDMVYFRAKASQLIYSSAPQKFQNVLIALCEILYPKAFILL